MNRKEFVAEITGYYGDFQNDIVAKRFVQTLSKINESDLEKLADWFFQNIPANWKIDVTTLTKGINSCCIFYHEEKKACPICRAQNRYSAKYCYNCGYDFAVPADEYRKTLADAETVTTAMRNIFSKLEAKKQEINCKNCKHHQFIDAHQQYECTSTGCNFELKE